MIVTLIPLQPGVKPEMVLTGDGGIFLIGGVCQASVEKDGILDFGVSIFPPQQQNEPVH